MNRCITVMLATLLLLSCESRDRERKLSEREAALDQKEQQLLLREKTIELREHELAESARMADSISVADSLSYTDTSLVGDWSVKMTCVETNCTGSAVGDTRVEQWALSYTGNYLVAKAMDHGKLIRTYSGVYNQNAIELTEHHDSAMTYDTRMRVRLRPLNATNIEGQREITRENDCRIVYSLTLDKICKR